MAELARNLISVRIGTRTGLLRALWRVLERIRPYAESAALAVNPPMTTNYLSPHALNTLAGILNQAGSLERELETQVPNFLRALRELDAELVQRFGQPSRCTTPVPISASIAGFRPILTAADLPKEGEPLPPNVVVRSVECLSPEPGVICPDDTEGGAPELDHSSPAHLRAVARFLVDLQSRGKIATLPSSSVAAHLFELAGVLTEEPEGTELERATTNLIRAPRLEVPRTGSDPGHAAANDPG
jgi:hypothetical protein